jgi:hypothetical protein
MNTLQTVEELKQLQRVVIKEELLALTGKHFDAALLNNLIFWAGIVEKMDTNLKNQIRQMEARNTKQTVIDKKKKQLRNGWFYKTGEEILSELMGWGSGSTISRTIDSFVKKGWMEKGNNPDPTQQWDRTKWYRVSITKIASDLHELGYALEGYSLSQEQPKMEEKQSEPAPLPILHSEKCILQDEKSILHSERTIPEGLLQKGTLEKDFEEEEVLPTVITEADILSLVNDKIKEREITNQKTITAILDVAANCKQIGGTDWEKAQNYVISIVEDKMKSFGQKQRQKNQGGSNRKSTRKEDLSEDVKQQLAEQAAEKQQQDNTEDLLAIQRQLEEEMKMYQKETANA